MATFTVLMNVFSNRHSLLPFIEQYTEHPLVDQVLLQTKDGFEPDLASLQKESGRDLSLVRVVSSTRNSLNDRFLPHAMIQTDAVLTVDDDVLWARWPGLLHFSQLFDYWNAHPEHRDRLIGFSGRGAERAGTRMQYTLPLQSCKHFNLVLTSAALLPTSFLSAYWEDSPRMDGARELVERWRNCEDLLMNFVAQNMSHAGPIALGARGECLELMDVSALRQSYPEINFGGQSLSQRPEHFEQRSMCLSHFSQQIFDQVLPNGLLDGHVSDETVKKAARCPVSGVDHRRIRNLGEYLLSHVDPGSEEQAEEQAEACDALADEVEPKVLERMRDAGIIAPITAHEKRKGAAHEYHKLPHKFEL